LIFKVLRMEKMECIPQWFPEHEPIYDINLSYSENSRIGPFMKEMPILKRKWKPKNEWIDFLGYKIASPIGIPAGPLLTSKWVELAAQLGFDVVTYKTIRSSSFDGHGLPNIIYVNHEEVEEYLEHPTIRNFVSSSSTLPKSLSNLAITNSFGMPSKSREFLEEDIPRANEYLTEGQIMIVSVVGTASFSNDKVADSTNFIRDFVETALFAKKCGAKMIEANFSCPNVTTGEGSIYQNPSSVHCIAKAIVQALGDDCPLILKVGAFKNIEIMAETLKAASKAKVKGICGINSVSMKVVSPNSNIPSLGLGRLASGICGSPIRSTAINFVRESKRILQKENIPIALLGCGGITEPKHFTEFIDAGANIAMSATGMMWDPYLALRYHKMI